MKRLEKTLSVIAVVSLVLIILILPLRVYIYNTAFYHYQFEKNNIDVQDREAILDNLLSFFKGGEDLAYFNVREQSHFSDVKNLLNDFFITLYASIVVFLFSMLSLFLICKKGFVEKKLKIVFISGLASFAMIVLFSLAALNFSATFYGFHLIFFPQGNFTFPADSLMLRLFPESFFKAFFLRIMGFSFLLSAVVMIPQLVYNKFFNR